MSESLVLQSQRFPTQVGPVLGKNHGKRRVVFLTMSIMAHLFLEGGNQATIPVCWKTLAGDVKSETVDSVMKCGFRSSIYKYNRQVAIKNGNQPRST